MTLERGGEFPSQVRLVECPFCGRDLSAREDRAGGARGGVTPAEHLRTCDAFEAAWRGWEDDTA